MRVMFGAIRTCSSYPSTTQTVVVRRITTRGQEVLRAGSVATGESRIAFANCRGSPGGKVCRGGRKASGEGGVWKGKAECWQSEQKVGEPFLGVFAASEQLRKTLHP